MDLFSFTSIIVILFLIIGVYILATGQSEGRAKIVLIVSLLVVFIVLMTNMSFFNSYTKGIAYPTPTTTETTIGNADNKYTLSSSYSLSMWIYISDWNNNLGTSKIICERTVTGNIKNPSIYLDKYKNKIKIDFATYRIEGQTANPVLSTIEVDNIAIQKWVNVIVCFGDNKIDTYINGKLEKSSLTNNTQFVPLTGLFPFTFNPKGRTYNGYISSVRYYARFLSPQESWDIYKEGFSNSLFGNFFNQYNATFKFQKGEEVLYELPLM
jgi:hypothetical protein